MHSPHLFYVQTLTVSMGDEKHRKIIMDTLFLLVISVVLAFGVGYLGSKRKIGFGIAFALSLLNVIIGLIAVLCSKKIDKVN